MDIALMRNEEKDYQHKPNPPYIPELSYYLVSASAHSNCLCNKLSQLPWVVLGISTHKLIYLISQDINMIN